jgi:hypothetical protein
MNNYVCHLAKSVEHITFDRNVIKAIPLQAWTGPEGFQVAEAPIFQDIWHMKVVSLSIQCTGRLYPPENISVRG